MTAGLFIAGVFSAFTVMLVVRWFVKPPKRLSTRVEPYAIGAQRALA